VGPTAQAAGPNARRAPRGGLAHGLGAAREHRLRLAQENELSALSDASNPEPHSRFTVTAGTSIGSPALSPM